MCSAIFLLTTWWISHGRVGLSLSQRSNKAPLCGWFGWYTKCNCQQRCYELRYVWYMWMSCVQKLEEKMTMALTCNPRTARGVTRQPDCHERHTPIRRTPINILKTCCCTHKYCGNALLRKGGCGEPNPSWIFQRVRVALPTQHSSILRLDPRSCKIERQVFKRCVFQKGWCKGKAARKK